MGGWGTQSSCICAWRHGSDNGGSPGLDYTIIREGIFLDAFSRLLVWKADPRAVNVLSNGPIHFNPRKSIGEESARVLLAGSRRKSIAPFPGPRTTTFGHMVEVKNEVMGPKAEPITAGFEPYVEGPAGNGKKQGVFEVEE
ncbi:unnamed protein product [Tuber aestivum]|uniref:NmrA-like domain-containing protein n=1 Tax=Tuber aestivum TaxID=59557 RepID=A0A292PQT1_9PEZI|nr:unnamed protein product [Tuber aestivum]